MSSFQFKKFCIQRKNTAMKVGTDAVLLGAWARIYGENILDIGTGGGFPGIPLAILFPEVKFHLVDSIGKKITVVQG